VRLNRLDPARPLLIGTKLRLPSAVRASTATAAVAASNAVAVRGLLDKWASYYGVDLHLAHALAWMESGYNNAMVSSVGARGVMQLLPSTWSYVEDVLLGHNVADHGPDGNIHVGMAYLHHLLGAFKGNEHLALAGWYQGERSVRKHGPLKVSKVFAANVLALKERM
jgi:soluble lytic murein transglycosylase-like protein